MTTFDLVQVQDFVASLDARLGPDPNGGWDSHAALNVALRDHGELCHEFTEEVRAWGRSVFSGRIEFDPLVEAVVRAEGARLAARAADLEDLGLTAGSTGETSGALDSFRPAVERMNRLLNHWVRPKLAV